MLFKVLRRWRRSGNEPGRDVSSAVAQVSPTPPAETSVAQPSVSDGAKVWPASTAALGTPSLPKAEEETRKELDPAASKTFCVLPWIHSHFTTDGQAALCCVSADHLPASDYGHLNLQRHNLREVFHSSQMDGVRRLLLEGKHIKACRVCYAAERTGRSLRTHYNTLWQDKVPGLMDIIKERQEKAAFDKPLSADVRFGNLCNLKCQICNPHNSSQIERDPILTRWNIAPYQRLKDGNRFPEGVEWYDAPEFEEELNEFTSDILFITLGGGEPSISKPAQKWFERLIASGQAAKVQIHISTNLTNVNPKFFDLAAQFGRTQFNLSIDGFGPLNDYLRYPSKWRIVERNADYIGELAKQANIEINVTPVINAYNALSITHLLEWADARSFGIVANQVRGVDAIDCALIPDDARKLVLQRLSDFLKSAKNPKPNYRTIEEFCRYLELPVDPIYAAACRERFHLFTHELDNDRGMRFETFSPEMADFLGYSSGSNSIGTGLVATDTKL